MKSSEVIILAVMNAAIFAIAQRSLKTEDDRSFCRNMSYKLRSFVVFFKVLTCLLISRGKVPSNIIFLFS